MSINSTKEPWLIMLMQYFGKWPEWIDLFVESCKWNPSVHWRIYTDCGPIDNIADNVELVSLSFEDYKALVSQRLNLSFKPSSPYKLCDLKPCLAHIHANEIGDFRFFGFGDVDVVYGNIDNFYVEDLLDRWDVLSTHDDRISGHFAVLRNTPEFRMAFEQIPGYKAKLEQPDYTALDEMPFGSLFKQRGGLSHLQNFLHPYRRRALFEERYSTILSKRGWHDGSMNYPQKWFWHEGRLTNDQDGDREFLYLHFMRWKNAQYESNSPALGQGTWLDLDRVVRTDWRRAGTNGFCISPLGFTDR